ncbi:hypothetical protein BH09PSE5_BH09PSE5_49230 [soil metagenome]
MQADHFFTIGSTHRLTGQPCEDYAISGALPDGRIYGVVCDGCSGAMARTDVGARVLGIAMERVLRETSGLHECFEPAFVDKLTETFRALSITEDGMDYLAGVVAFCADSQEAKVFMMGDGAYAISTYEGDLELTEVHWPNNAPYYLGYRMQAEFDRLFRQDVAPHTRVEIRSSSRARRRPEDAVAPYEQIQASRFMEGYVRSFDLSGIKTLAVFTDGVSQVRGASAIQVCDALLDYRDDSGAFVKRRALRALAAFDRSGFVVEDDLAVASLTTTDGSGDNSGNPTTSPGTI